MADEKDKKQKGQKPADGKPQGKKAKPEQVEAAADQGSGKPTRPKANNRSTARMRDKYVKEVLPVLMKEFGLENPMAAPKLEKIVVNMGKTSTRGHKGQGSRSGSSLMRGFEGGQMPLHRRLPKRGFTNIFKTEYEVVNLDRLATLSETEITPEVLRKAGVVTSKNTLVKVLGQGELSKALTVHAHKFSKSAQEKIEKAGGKIQVL